MTAPAFGSDELRCRRSAVDGQAITFATALLTLAPTEQAGTFARLTRHWQFLTHCFSGRGESLGRNEVHPKALRLGHRQIAWLLGLLLDRRRIR